MSEASFAIAAAGTGGHVFPGLAVAAALTDLGVSSENVLFIGGTRMEAQVIPEAGYPFVSVELQGLQRSLTLANLTIPIVVARAVRDIGHALAERGTDVLLGMGGYVTVPAVLAAKRHGVVAMVSEQNAEAGLANRISARLSRRVFGAFPHTEGLGRAEWVGNPIRSEIGNPTVSREEAVAGYGLDPSRPTVGVIGGSLGAKALNEAVVAMARDWQGPPIQILHLVGEQAAAELTPLTDDVDLAWRVIGFEPRMEQFYPAVDLVVSRAGGMVAELTATNTPSILVPGTFGSGEHQAQNALVLERHGAAVILEEDHLGKLGDLVADLIDNRDLLAHMRSSCVALSRPEAAQDIAEAMVGAVS